MCVSECVVWECVSATVCARVRLACLVRGEHLWCTRVCMCMSMCIGKESVMRELQ